MVSFKQWTEGLQATLERESEVNEYRGKIHDYITLKESVGWNDIKRLLEERLQMVRDELEDPNSILEPQALSDSVGLLRVAILRQEARDIRFIIELPDKMIDALKVDEFNEDKEE